MEKDSTGSLRNVIRIDDERIQEHLGKSVRGSVEDTLNALLDAEAQRLVGAGRYERTEARRDRLRHIAGTKGPSKRYLNMKLLEQQDMDEPKIAKPDRPLPQN